MSLSLIYGTIIGLLLGLGYCYWKQLQAVQKNAGLIAAGGNVVSDVQTLYGEIKNKL